MKTETTAINKNVDQDSNCLSCKENDRVLIRESEGVLEVLVYESCSSDSWLQESIIEKKVPNKNVMYSKGDSAKLEKFLLKEGNVGAVIQEKWYRKPIGKELYIY